MESKNKYDLTDEEYVKCLKRAEIAIFMDAISSKNPTSAFVVAQPGAGKTGLRAYVESEYQKSDLDGLFIDFNPDEVAIYHKYYSEILEEFPKESHKLLQRFVLPALDDYLRYKAVQFRNNIMQEGTFASTNGYIKIIDFQKNGGKAKIGGVNKNGQIQELEVKGGYNVDINILAVHRYESLLSSYEREQYFIENNLPPRVVTAENHDRAYNNILNTVKIIEQNKMFDNMRVFKRGKIEQKPILVYSYGDMQYQDTIQAIVIEREKDKQRLFANSNNYLERIQTLKNRISKNRNDSQIQMEKLIKLEEEFLQELKNKQQGDIEH